MKKLYRKGDVIEAEWRDINLNYILCPQKAVAFASADALYVLQSRSRCCLPSLAVCFSA